MKTISVKQVAEALNLTTRAVVYRLEKGQLKGTQTPNAFGKAEWRVYPTKEIAEGLRKAQGGSSKENSIGDQALNFSPEAVDIIDAAEIEFEQSKESTEDLENSWREQARDTLKGLAEELVRPLVETVRAQQELLAEKERIIQEKDLKLRLLPDFQKQAEEERKAAELKELEIEALKKQISAVERERQSAQEQADKIKSEKEAEGIAIQEQLAALSKQLQELQQPKPSFWQKFFGMQ